MEGDLQEVDFFRDDLGRCWTHVVHKHKYNLALGGSLKFVSIGCFFQHPRYMLSCPPATVSTASEARAVCECVVDVGNSFQLADEETWTYKQTGNSHFSWTGEWGW